MSIRSSSQFVHRSSSLAACLLGAVISHAQTAPASDVWGAQENAAKSKTALRGTDAKRPGKPGEDAAQRDARLGWWRDARFGMFIHWGLYAQAAGEWQGKQVKGGMGEWIQSVAKIPTPQYVELGKQFNPVKLDARAWVRAAKDAGMRYIVITAKHHDGFAMWDSKVTDYDIVERTPFKRDPLKELAEACKEEGIRFGLYYSQNLDWQDPFARGNEWEHKREGADFPRYVKEKALPQIRELLTNYGPIAEVWWDFPLFATQQEGDEFRKLAWELQPNALQNDRAGGDGGDFSTPEQTMPGETASSDFESCMTMNDTWGYRSYDHNWKSSAELIRNLTNTASKGGNFLINVGPDGLGQIPAPSLRIMREVGAWLKVNGESIYGCGTTPVGTMPWGRVTSKPGRLFLHVMDWPADGVVMLPIQNSVTSARLLAQSDGKLVVEKDGGCVRIIGPKQAPDAKVTTIEVTVDGEVTAGSFLGQRLINSGFELEGGNESWTGSHRQLMPVKGEKAIAGSQSLSITLGVWGDKKQESGHQTVRVNPGVTLALSGKINSEGCDAAQALLEVEVSDANQKRLLLKQTVPVNGGMGVQSVTLEPFVAPAGAHTATVRMSLRKKSDDKLKKEQKAIFDDIKLVATPVK